MLVCAEFPALLAGRRRPDDCGAEGREGAAHLVISASLPNVPGLPAAAAGEML
jgi:hypothetical protein